MSNALKITDIVDEKAFADLRELNRHLLETKSNYSEVAKSIGMGIKMPVGSFEDLSKKASQYENAMKKLTESQKEIIKLQGQYTTLMNNVNKRVKEAVAAERERTKAKQQQTITLQEALALAEQEVHSINEANEANKKLRAVIRTLRNDVADEAEAMKILNEAVDRNSQVVNENSDAYTRQKRNVGNYKSAFDGLGVSVQQIVREMPALTMGANTFFLAISNNLPMLVDQIALARAEFAAAKAAGDEAVPVWKQLLKSIISWQTLMMVGITVLSMYGKEIKAWVGSLFKAEKGLDSVKEAEKKLHDARVDGYKDSAKERSELNLLYRATQDVKRSIKERTAAADELKQKYPSYLEHFSNEEILSGKAATAYEQLKKNILATAQARAFADKLAEVTNQKLDLEIKKEKELQRMRDLEESSSKGTATTVKALTAGDFTIVGVTEELTEDAKAYNKAAAAVEKYTEELKAYENEISIIESKINIIDFVGETTDVIGEVNDSIKDELVDGTEGLTDILDKTLQGIPAAYEKNLEKAKDKAKQFNEAVAAFESTSANIQMNEELNELADDYSKGLISRETYEKEKERIIFDNGIKQLEIARDLVKQQLDVENLSAEEQVELQKRLATLTLEIDKKKRGEIEEGAEDTKEKVKVSMEEMLNFASDVLGGIGELGNAIFEGKIQKIEEEEEANEEAHEKEIERIDQLAETGAISEEEAEARKRAAEDKTAAREAELAKKKADLQTKQAKMDKAISVTQTIIATALGIMTTISKLGFPAAIPFVAMQSAIGAIQLASIIAQPIPKYAKGTKGHKGGLAIVGDGGREEAVIANGEIWATPSVPTLVNLPKDAIVLPDLRQITGRDGMYSDLLPLADSRHGKGGVVVNVHNDYKKLEERMSNNSDELRAIKKLLRIQNRQAERAFIYGRV